MHRTVATGVMLALSGAAQAQSISLADLNGVTIHTTDNYRMVGRNEVGQGTISATIQSEIHIGPGSAIRWSFTRSAVGEKMTRKGPATGSISRSGSGSIGVPAKGAKGSGVWILQGNTLVLLRVFQVGGYTMRITLSKSGSGFGCSLTSAMAREVGAGNTKLTAVMPRAQTAEILSSQRIGGSCRATKG